ncbi:MAG TPA: SpoIIE family protein phosphatase [Dongiaceae bacterium]|nr:SpoIIE family protein phosphatase [Dongiaceae bacterium]
MLLNSKLARRLVLWMGGVATLIFAIGIFLDYRLSREHIIRNSELEAAEVIRSSAADLRTRFQGVQRSTDLFAGVLADSDISLDEMTGLLERAVSRNPDLYGAAIAIEPALSGRPHGFSPYYFHAGDDISFVDLSRTYPRGYAQEAWFVGPRREMRPLWSEPYFDAGGGNALMATYSVPILRKHGSESVFFGVVTADISLKSIQAFLSKIHLGSSGFAFLLSQQGSLISFPDDQYLLQTFPAVFPAISANTLWQRAIFHALNGQQNIVRLPCPHQQDQCLLAYSPFADTGWALMVVYPEKEMLAELNQHIFKIVLTGIGCIFALLLSVVFIARSITHPLVTLTAAADKLGSGDMEVTLPQARGDDEVAHLVIAFRNMKLRLRAYIAQVEQEATSRSRLQGELNAARQIQMEMLPQAGNAHVRLPTHEIHARLIPAKAVGGDLYTWFQPDETHIFLVIGDVSDKGVPAALFMARVVTLLQQHLVPNIAPPEVLSLLNDGLVERNDACMFATLSCVRVDMESGAVDWASAGHGAPLLKRANRVTVLEQEHGPALGLMEAQDFPTNSTILTPGDVLLLCTDGIDEAMSTAHELFGMRRLHETVQDCPENTVERLIECVLEKVREHASGEPQSDDITLLVFAWKGPRHMLIHREWLQFSSRAFPANLPAIAELFAWLTDWCREQSVPDAALAELKLVAEELFVNIVHYSGLSRSDQICVQLARAEDTVGLEFIDAGRPWNPLEDSAAPILGVDSEEVDIGGLGVHLVRELTDEQCYRREFSDNRFCVVNRIVEANQ